MCGSVRWREAQLWLSFNNFARNSSLTHSNFEFASLELQRFWDISKNDRDKLRAKCGRRWRRRRPWVPQPSPAAHGCRSLAPPRPRLGPAGLALAFTHIAVELLNFACNSPTNLSNYEFTTLELQRFQTLLKLHPIELHASFLSSGHVAASGRRGSFALNRFARARVGLKPLSPLQAGEVDQLKLASPLRVKNGCF